MRPDSERPSEHQRAGAYFDRSGELFDSLYSLEKSNAVMRWINRVFRRDIYQRYLLTINHLKESGATSVLDVGVGGARYAEGYLEAGLRRVVGVDISSTMIEFAKEHVGELAGHERVFEFIVSDIDSFESAEKFDVVVAMGFFDYIPQPVTVLQRFLDVCNHSVVASFPSISLWRTPIRKLRYWLKNCPVYFFRRDQIIDLAQQAGFASCTVQKIRGSGMDYVAIMKK